LVCVVESWIVVSMMVGGLVRNLESPSANGPSTYSPQRSLLTRMPVKVDGVMAVVAGSRHVCVEWWRVVSRTVSL
jgi:hypothetical protein